MDWLQPAMVIMVVAMVGLMVFNMIKDMFGKKKPKTIEVARDSNERLDKAYKRMIKGKLNHDNMRHTLWITGDKYIQGFRVGDITGIQPQNEMYKMHVKRRWWYFWKKSEALYIDPILCSDLNTPDIVVQCKGFEAVTEGVAFPIPIESTPNLEAIYVGRNNWRMSRIHKQTMDDLNQDGDFLLKMAMRGDMTSAGAEIERPDSMLEIEESKIRRQQEKDYKRKVSGEI